MRTMNVASAILAVLMLLPVSAAAQAEEPRGWYMDVQRYHPTFDTLGGFQVESSRVLDLWQPSFGLHFNYANRALVQYDTVEGSREFAGALVGDLFAMDVQAAMGFRYADVAVIIPVTLAMVNKAGDVYGYPNFDSYSGFGDIRFAAKGNFLDPNQHVVGLGLILPMSLPSGNAHLYNGSWGPSFTPQLLVETIQLDGKLHAAINVGPHITYSVVYESIDGREIIRNGPEFRLSANVGYRVAEPVDLNAEIITAFGMGGESNATRNPVEWRVGARIYPKDWLSLNVALGSGMSPGIGAPAFRFLFGASFTPSLMKDTDKDKIPDRDDLCPEDAEDRDGYDDADGCPDPDNDGDGVEDIYDECPDELENRNGFEDHDGCADDNPDADGDGIAADLDDCPDQAEDMDGFADGDGCPDPDNDNDGVADAADVCPQGAEVFNGVDDTDGCPDEGPVALDLAAGKIALVQPLNFLSRKAVLEPDAKATLDAVAALMNARPDLLQVEVQVHTDDQGDDDFNLRFSDARAQIIRLHLIEQGVDESRLVAKGYGENKPLIEGTTAKSRAVNRRVEFVILDVAE
jgi:large repetitive protein